MSIANYKAARARARERQAVCHVKEHRGRNRVTWSFRFVAANGEELASSKQRYSRKFDLRKALTLIRNARMRWV